MVPVDRALHRLDETVPAPARLVLVALGVAQGDARLCGQVLDGGHEVEVLDLADEGDGVTLGLAAPAVVEPELLVHEERRRLLGVKGAQARPLAAGSLELGVLADERNDVGRLAQAGDVLVDDPHPGDGSESLCCSAAVTTGAARGRC